jgi:hypothetical protein
MMNGRLLDRVVADGQDQVGLVDRLVHVVAVGQRGRSHPQLGSAFGGAQTGDRSLAHLGVEERNAERRMKSVSSPARRGRLHAAPNITSGRSARISRLGAVERVGVRAWDLHRVHPHEWHFPSQLLPRDVLGSSRCTGPGRSSEASRKASRTDGRNAGGADDLAGRLGQRLHRRDDVDDLEARLAARS